MRTKRILTVLLAGCLCLSVLGCKDPAPAGPSEPTDTPPAVDRVVTDYGVEVLEPFALPVVPTGTVTARSADGEEITLTPDGMNRVVFTAVGDYTLTVPAADGTHTYNLYVRDTKAPVFGSVTLVTSCLAGTTFDLSTLNVAVDDYSAVKYRYEVYHMAATPVPVRNGTFLAEDIGYYIVYTEAKDEAGNRWTRRSKIWCGEMDDNEINWFDDMFLMKASSGTFSDTIRMGDEGYALKATANSTDCYASCSHPRDLSEVTDIYYWVYFDSASWRNENADDGVGELPEITNLGVVPGIPGWTKSNLADLEFDTWIPMVMKRNAGTAPLTGQTIQFYFNNREVPWGLPVTSDEDGWGAHSGYTYDIYIDNLSYSFSEPLPVTPELAYTGTETFFRSDGAADIDVADVVLPEGVEAADVTLSADFSKSEVVRVYDADDTEIGWFRVAFKEVTVLQDFNTGASSYTNAWYNEAAGTKGYGSAFFTGERKIGYTGSSLGINFNGNTSLGRTSYIAATTTTELYYYVYFDSSKFSPLAVDNPPITELPALTQARVQSIKPAGWTAQVVDAAQVEWDRWILVRATRTTSEEITRLSWYLENFPKSWGAGDATNTAGCNAQVFVDDMFIL